jgi:glycosyltransferase involved in cell wall biosynthesis
MTVTGHKIGFVGTRFSGTDGVSLESAKWARILWDHRHVSYWFAGELDRDPDISMHVPHAYFGHPDIQWIDRHVFGRRTREPEVTRQIYAISAHLKQSLYEFVERFQIEILIAQNSLTIPMNLPLGLALTTFIAETGFPTIAHHHDFYWERDRFAVNAVADLLGMAFPPALSSIAHATINSFAQEDLCHRRGVSSTLIPNVLDFETLPPEPDEYACHFRPDVHLADDDVVFLQPTRIVPRKGIEHSIAMVAALKNPKAKLLISHKSGDEGHDYKMALQEMAQHSGVDMRFVDEVVDDERSHLQDGRRVYTLEDVYSQSDVITYPSSYEGFGNALLEAFYYRKPVLVNRYSIFISDIEPRGFRVITMNGYLTRDVISHVEKVIQDSDYRQQMVDHNYELGKSFFSYSVLRRKLRALITNFTGADDL